MESIIMNEKQLVFSDAVMKVYSDGTNIYVVVASGVDIQTLGDSTQSIVKIAML